MIDWDRLAVEVGSIDPSRPDTFSSGSGYAQKALECILGEDNIRAAVELAVSFAPSGWLAASVLRFIQSLQALEMAYAIYKKSSSADQAFGAVWLIKEIGHRRSLDWIEEFLADERIASPGVDVLDQLIFIHQVEPEDERVVRLLALMDDHASEEVRAKAAHLREYIRRRDTR